jgi:exonuclease 3'-5' domain-containing protein 1
MKYLSQENIIGVAAEGVNLGRNGQLCLLQFATTSHVFIFDILVLGQTAFTEGLTELLECCRILKVIHDCRLISDIMFHQFGTKLVNIFDTQVSL